MGEETWCHARALGSFLWLLCGGEYSAEAEAEAGELAGSVEGLEQSGSRGGRKK